MPKIERSCKTCNKKFYVFISIVKKGKGIFCSKKCRPSPSKGKQFVTKSNHICITCNKEFTIYPSDRKRRTGIFCSRRCVRHSERTKQKISNSTKGLFCGENNPSYKGGRNNHSAGYCYILMHSHPFCNCRGYIFEHRLIVEKFINRFLTQNEMVHHINKIKDDNRPENLMAFNSNSAHIRFEAGNHYTSDEIIFDGRLIKRNNL